MAKFKANEVDVSNGVSISSTGITLQNDGTVWNDMMVPLTGLASGGLQVPSVKEFMDSTGYPGALGGNSYIGLWHFAANQEQDLSFTTQMQHDWKLGSTVRPHVHWMAKTNTAGNIRFGIEFFITKSSQTAHVGPLTSTHRESSTTTKKIYFASAHGIRKYRQIVVSGITDGTYNGDNSANNNTFIVTNYSDTAPDYWIEYTGSGSSTEGKTVDDGGTIYAYAYRMEITDTQVINTQGMEYLVSFDDLEMDTHNGLSAIMVGRFYRVLNSSVPGGLNEDVPIVQFDLHYEMDALGSNQEFIK